MNQTPRPSMLPLHDPLGNGRVLIECIDGWEIWGPNRRDAGYASSFEQGSTPIQMLTRTRSGEVLSILTPCQQTGGKFEYSQSHVVERRCCYTCLSRRLMRVAPDVTPLDFRAWIVYLMLESSSYLNGPAPRELP